MRQLLHGVHSLLAPPPSSFDCQNHKLTPPRRSKFWISGLLVLTCLHQDGSVMVRGVWVGFTIATERTAQRDVHRQLRTGETRQILRENFDVPRVWAGTLMFMSWRKTFCQTHAPASRNTRAVMCSMALARLFTRPLRVQEAR